MERAEIKRTNKNTNIINNLKMIENCRGINQECVVINVVKWKSEFPDDSKQRRERERV